MADGRSEKPDARTAQRAAEALASIRRGSTPAQVRADRDRRAILSARYASGMPGPKRPMSARSVVKSLLRGALSGAALWEPVALELLRRDWGRVLSDAFGRSTAPSSLTGGTLEIVAETAAWAEEVKLHAEEIRKRAGRVISSGSTVRAVRARVGPLPPVVDAPVETPAAPVPDPIWAAIVRKEAEAVIPDTALRERIVSWLAKQAWLDLKREEKK